MTLDLQEKKRRLNSARFAFKAMTGEGYSKSITRARVTCKNHVVVAADDPMWIPSTEDLSDFPTTQECGNRQTNQVWYASKYWDMFLGVSMLLVGLLYASRSHLSSPRAQSLLVGADQWLSSQFNAISDVLEVVMQTSGPGSPHNDGAQVISIDHSAQFDLNILEDLINGILERKLNRFRPPLATALRDFALEVDGAIVDCTLTSWCYPWPISVLWPSPSLAISENSHIGQCWSMPTTPAQLAVVLPTPVRPSHVTIDHIPSNIASDIGLAPRNMILWGVIDGHKNQERLNRVRQHLPRLEHKGPSRALSYTFVPIARMTYDIGETSHVQTFPVFDSVRTSSLDFAIVVLEITDNWGSEKTCLYRLRVHGEPVSLPVRFLFIKLVFSFNVCFQPS